MMNVVAASRAALRSALGTSCWPRRWRPSRRPEPARTRRPRSRRRWSTGWPRPGRGRPRRPHHLALEHDGLTDPGLGRFEAVGQHLFGDLGRTLLVVLKGPLGAAGLHHHDGDLGVGGVGQGPPGHHQLEGGLVALLEGGVRDPLAVGGVGHPDRPDGTLEGDARDHQRGRSGVDGQDVVRIDLVGAEDGADDVDLVAEALRERRAQGRSIRRQVRMAWSVAPPSRRKNEPGIFRRRTSAPRCPRSAGRSRPLPGPTGRRWPSPVAPCRRSGHDGSVGQLGQLAGLE